MRSVELLTRTIRSRTVPRIVPIGDSSSIVHSIGIGGQIKCDHFGVRVIEIFVRQNEIDVCEVIAIIK